ncbi:hypothetical protein PO002_04925 [Cupriavidus necator]|uniref:hypothetical protein n=1 Tax=Cupriavidus necator TaxID=106590 RepID=UPI0039C26A5E
MSYEIPLSFALPILQHSVAQAPATTSVGTQSTAPEWSGDLMCRLTVDPTGIESRWVLPTPVVQQRLQAWASAKEHDVAALKRVTRWQKRRLDYQALYNAYVLGAVSEDDFLKDAEEFSSDIKEVSEAQIAENISHLSRLLDFELTASDYADFMDTETYIVQQVVAKLLAEDPAMASRFPSLAGSVAPQENSATSEGN